MTREGPDPATVPGLQNERAREASLAEDSGIR
jgi:hypothetical protein